MNYEKYIALLKVKKKLHCFIGSYWSLVLKKFKILEEKKET